MYAILAAILALGPVNAPSATAARPQSVAAQVAAPSPLPGSPRSVTLTHATEGDVVTWQAPARSGATPLTGYIVIVGDAPTILGADATRLVIAPTTARIAVAAMNGVGCSIASEAVAGEPRSVIAASSAAH